MFYTKKNSPNLVIIYFDVMDLQMHLYIYITCPCVSTRGKSMIEIWSILVISLRSITTKFTTLGFELGKWSGPMCSKRRIYENPRVKAIPHMNTDSITLLGISPCTFWMNMQSIKR